MDRHVIIPDAWQLGGYAMKRLEEASKDVKITQTRCLMELLAKNCHTEYGRKYGFEEIAGVEEYQKKVPLSDYNDYEAYIERMIHGEEGCLTSENCAYYAISSGSTGKPKFIPVSTDGLYNHYLFAYGTVFGMVQQYYSGLSSSEIHGKIFEVGEFRRCFTPGGVMCGIRSSSLFQWMESEGSLNLEDYTSPREVLFPEGSDDMIYIKARLALQEREVRAIHSVFVHRVTGMFQYITDNWDMFVRDIRDGTVDERSGLSRKWRCWLTKRLKPDPVRAGELSLLSADGPAEGMIPKIWKNIKYLLCIGGSSYSKYMEQLKLYAAHVPVHYYAYAASEGVLGIARGLDREDAYILIPEAGFMEFFPLDEKEGPKTMWQLKKGGRYEVVITNLSGFCRYRLGDVVEVVDYYLTAPVIRFCYRKNQIMNIAGEKMNTEQAERVMALYEKENGLSISQYCIYGEMSVSPGHYVVLLETRGKRPEKIRVSMDKCMSMVNQDYPDCRETGEIAEAEVFYLSDNSFTAYKEMLASQGYEMGQNKPLRLLDTEEKKQFFFSRIDCNAENCKEV